MIKQSITYKDPFTEEMLTKDFYFNLTMAELVKLETSKEGGFFEAAQYIIKHNEAEKVLPILDKLVMDAYGIKTSDGDFDKTPEISARFMSSEAYSVLFMDFLTDAKLASDFFNGLVPHDMAEQAAKFEKINAEQAKKIQDVVSPLTATKTRLTLAEMQTLSKEEIEARLRRGDMPPAPTQ